MLPCIILVLVAVADASAEARGRALSAAQQADELESAEEAYWQSLAWSERLAR